MPRPKKDHEPFEGTPWSQHTPAQRRAYNAYMQAKGRVRAERRTDGHYHHALRVASEEIVRAAMRAWNNAGEAQSVVQLLGKEKVEGANPSTGTNTKPPAPALGPIRDE